MTISLIRAANKFQFLTRGLTTLEAQLARDAAVVARTGAETARTGAETARTGSETARDLSQVARVGSEAARDIAAGYASDASTRSDTVPLYATAVGMSALSLANGLNYFRTNGYYAADGKGAASYRLKSAPEADIAGDLVTNGGTKRWQLVPQNGAVDVQSFGAKGDGVTDDTAAFQSAIAYLKATSFNQDGPNLKGAYKLLIPGGKYEITTTLDFKGGTTVVEGIGHGFAGGQPTILEFAKDITGIRVHTHLTNTTIKDPTSGPGSDGFTLRNLNLRSKGGNVRTAHGFHGRTRFRLDNVSAFFFPGNGINVDATSGGTGIYEGNANCFQIIGGRVQSNGNCGLFVEGADANAGFCLGLDASNNARWGIYDSSFLGNTYVGCHTAANGIYGTGVYVSGDSSTVGSQVIYGGNKYYLAFGKEALGGTTTPGTDATVWVPVVAYPSGNPIYPDWVEGGTYAAGGGYASDNVNARNLFLGCYSEGDQAPSHIVSPAMALGGLFGNSRAGTGPVLTGSNNMASSQKPFRAEIAGQTTTGTVTSTLGGNPDFGFWTTQSHPTYAPLGWSLAFSYVDSTFTDVLCAYNRNNVVYRLTGPGTARTYGRTAAVPYAFELREFFLGNGNSSKSVTMGQAAPTTGSHSRGEIVFNNGDLTSIDTVDRWRCTVSGTPGTWVAKA